MSFVTRFRSPLAAVGLLTLVCAATSRCYALAEIEPINKDRARQLGITVTTGPSANSDLRVQVDFKTTGALKGFRWADLALARGGKRLISSSLAPQKQDPDRVHLEFYLDPAALADTTVTIFAYEGRSGIGYEMRMKEFPLVPGGR